MVTVVKSSTLWSDCIIMTDAEQTISPSTEADQISEVIPADTTSDHLVDEPTEPTEPLENNNSEEAGDDKKYERKRRQSDAIKDKDTLDNVEARKRRQSDAGVYNQKRVRLEEVEQVDEEGQNEDGNEIKENGDAGHTKENNVEKHDGEATEVEDPTKAPELSEGNLESAEESAPEGVVEVSSDVQIVIETIDESDERPADLEECSDQVPEEEEISVPPTLEAENSTEEEYSQVSVLSVEEVSLATDQQEEIVDAPQETNPVTQHDGIEPELPEDILDPPVDEVVEEQQQDQPEGEITEVEAIPENGDQPVNVIAPQAEPEKKPCGGQDEGLHVLAAAATENASEPSGEATEPVAEV
ncbi:unnamed protein product [Bursaphelenchus xylophilus]|uniref:(pine wood nematode) hypothetical protein n=1 Tax=Bursaphelenchus xylophilus TaxID=6326 RepID=A0A1I7RZ33_BURXY|nr:unnamed protein product [Bursaphelenchus xylophilus]CAG9106904.1 unnamed protein product [Bursaphelenchus xylophilus]